MKHGLLSREVVITRGDYRENAEDYARLFDGLTVQFEPEGVAEELEVQKIALYYWRKIRAVRYEHGAIRTRTADMRGREQRSREAEFERALNFNFGLEHSLRGLHFLIEGMEVAKQEALDGQVSSASLEGLMKYFPDDFLPNDEAEYADGAAAGDVVGPPEYLRELVARMEEQLERLRPLREGASRRRCPDSRPRSVPPPYPHPGSWTSSCVMKPASSGSWTAPLSGSSGCRGAVERSLEIAAPSPKAPEAHTDGSLLAKRSHEEDLPGSRTDGADRPVRGRSGQGFLLEIRDHRDIPAGQPVARSRMSDRPSGFISLTTPKRWVVLARAELGCTSTGMERRKHDA